MWLKRVLFKKPLTWCIGSQFTYFNMISTVDSDQQLEGANQEMHVDCPMKSLGY